MINEGDAIIFTDTLHLRQALISVETELFMSFLHFGSVCSQHVLECFVFIILQLAVFADQVLDAAVCVSPMAWVLLK